MQTTQTLSIEDALRKIAADNDANYVGVSFNTDQREGAGFVATIQWHGFSSTGIACASANGPDVATALSHAISEAKVSRGQLVEGLPTLEMAVSA